jgi:hypothetical protein
MPGIDGSGVSTRVLLYQMHMGACGYILSHQVISGAAIQGPGCYGACSVLVCPRVCLLRGAVMCWVVRRIHSDQTDGKIMPVHDCCDEERTGLVHP